MLAEEPDYPLFIVMNAAAGNGDSDALAKRFRGILDAAGRKHEILRVSEGSTLPLVAASAVAKAKATRGAVVAVGGDGTINRVARSVLGSGCTFGVIPQGTFNFFARAHGISEDPEEALRAILQGHTEGIQVGLVNARPFLVNASLGLHPRILEEREKATSDLGRSRWVAYVSGLVAIMQRHTPLDVTVDLPGKHQSYRTLTLFVSNGPLQLETLGVDASDTENGRLTATLLKPVGRIAMLSLAVRGAMGRLGESENVTTFGLRHMVVRPRSRRDRPMTIQTDGEVARMRPPFEFRVLHDALRLLKPNPTTQANGAHESAPVGRFVS